MSYRLLIASRVAPTISLCVMEHLPTAAISFRILELYGGLTFSPSTKVNPDMPGLVGVLGEYSDI